MKFCRFCGRPESDDKALFCEHCGKPFSPAPEDEQTCVQTQRDDETKDFSLESALLSQENEQAHQAQKDSNQTNIESVPTQNIKVTDKEQLKQLILKTISEQGYECDLNFIDVSEITDMSFLFKFSMFNGNISRWNVSNVQNMNSMFEGSSFNGDISNWDVSNVTDMREMFTDSLFNGDISNWDVSNVKNIREIFRYSKFHGDISHWKLKKAKSLIYDLLLEEDNEHRRTPVFE